MTHRVTLIPGDGIGPEVCDAARRAIEATGVGDRVGRAGVRRRGVPAGGAGAAGARDRLRARARGGAEGPHLRLRPAPAFGRSTSRCGATSTCTPGCAPAARYPGSPRPFPQTDVVVVRMNTEDLYAGIEYDARRGHRRHAARDRGRHARHRAARRHRHLAEAAVARRRGARRAGRVRVRARQRPAARDRGAQGDRDARHRRAVPRGVPRGRRRLPRTSSSTTGWWTTPARSS